MLDPAAIGRAENRVGAKSKVRPDEEEFMSTVTTQDWQQDLSTPERELLREVALALRSIRYGSVTLMVHDGRIVELNKTERVRKGPG